MSKESKCYKQKIFIEHRQPINISFNILLSLCIQYVSMYERGVKIIAVRITLSQNVMS